MKRIVSLLLIVLMASTTFSKTENNKKVFSPKYIKGTMIKTVEWQLKNPKHSLTDWTNGTLYAGIFATWETTKSRKIYNNLMDMGMKNNWKPGERWYHADDIAICQTYI